MNKLAVVIIFSYFYTLIFPIYSKEISCQSQSFICQDEQRYFRCGENSAAEGKFFRISAIQYCPTGLCCNDLNEFPCEEDITYEYLIAERNGILKNYSEKEWKRHIIDD